LHELELPGVAAAHADVAGVARLDDIMHRLLDLQGGRGVSASPVSSEECGDLPACRSRSGGTGVGVSNKYCPRTIRPRHET
jgi:hypothetical protein